MQNYFSVNHGKCSEDSIMGKHINQDVAYLDDEMSQD